MVPRSFRLCLMGLVELRDANGAAVPLRTRKIALLLAILATAGDWQRRSDLAEAVWEDSKSEAAGVSLRVALSTLRTVLGPEAIRSQGDAVCLLPSLVVLVEDDGEFMPGYEEAWAIDRRLQLRAGRVAALLDAARAATDPAQALAHAKDACAVDPLDVEALRLRATLLASSGRNAEAAYAGRTHRARVVRELGSVPSPTAPPPMIVENPLLRAFEWTMERDPNEACALLAATSNQWLWSDVETALLAHRRVLSATHHPSQERQVVKAVASFLEVASGRLEGLDAAAEGHREAVDSGEHGIAGLLCYPLAQGFAARGDLARAANYHEAALHEARARADVGGGRAALALAENALGIFEGSAGNLDASARRIDAASALIEEEGAPLRVWGIRWSQAAAWIEIGQFDRAAERLDGCGRAAADYGGARFMPWIVGSQARLYERLGELRAAREAYVRMRAIAPEAGPSVVMLADEGLMRVHCGLHEYREATEAWARVVRFRREGRVVASARERQLAAPTLRILRERSSRSDLLAALRRAVTV